MFQNDLMNGGKQLMGPILLLWVEKGGGGDSSLHLMTVCMHDVSSVLAGRHALQAHSCIPLVCCKTSTSAYRSATVSSSQQKGKGAAGGRAGAVLQKAEQVCTFCKELPGH